MNKNVLNLILALLIYLPTCAFVPLNVYLILIGFVIFLDFNFLKSYFSNLLTFKIIDKPFTFLVLFSFLIFCLRLTDYSNWESFKDVYSFAYLFPFTYLISKTLFSRKGVFLYLIYFILIECAFSFLEYLLGVSSVFTGLLTYNVFTETNLLYETRVTGLSIAASVLSIKFLIGLLLVNIFISNQIKKIIFETVLLISSLFAFGRIAIAAIVFFYIIKFLHNLFISKKHSWINFSFLIGIAILIILNFSWVKSQFSRNGKVITNTGRITNGIPGNGNSTIVNNNGIEVEEIEFVTDIDYLEMIGFKGVEMSGRNEIWNNFIHFGVTNLYEGNKGKKYMLGSYHAHNSYLEIFSTFGIILFLILMSIFVINLNKVNYIYVFTFMFLALGQYVFFWGMSFCDIIFYYLVFFYKKENE